MDERAGDAATQSDTRPFVSVVVPVYNDARRIGACIAALLAQSYPTGRYEVLVVDNNSTDATPAAVGRMAPLFEGRLRYVREQRQGLSHARNRAIDEARAWARGETSGFAASEARGLQTLPTALDQQARAEFGLAEWLARHGAPEAAERHFVRAGELAPHDFTIRRGSMPIRGIDPMGPQFREMLQTWVGGGRPYYRPLPDTRG